MNPLDWPAIPFLRFYVLLCLSVGLIIFLLRRVVKGAADPLSAGELNFLELAYLSGGAQRVADTIMVGLMTAGAATYDAKERLFSFQPAQTALPKELEPVAAQLGGWGSRQGVTSALHYAVEEIRDRLVRRGLVLRPERQNLVILISLALIVLLLLIGVAKIGVGLDRHHPVGVLEVMVFAELIAGIIVARSGPIATAAGNKALSDSQLRYARLARAPLAPETALAFAIAGAAVLVGTPFAAFGQSIRSQGDGSGGGCGGGGGGGCGGGCGGCGGS